jgi:thiol:disulfide interchange protein DsbA
MDCQQIDAILDAHGARTQSAAVQTEIDAHLASCQRCADAWLSAEWLAADRPEAPRPELFDEIAATVFDQNRKSGRRSGRRFGVGFWAGFGAPVGTGFGARIGVAASVVALIGFAGLLFYGADRSVPDAGGGGLADSESVAPAASNRSLVAAPVAAPVNVIGEFMAGRDYELVRNPAPQLSNASQVQVCEFFMFKCIYCFNFEASLSAWEQTLPDDVSLERVPALFNPLARLHAQAFYTAELLGAERGLQTKFYEELHVFGNPLDTPAAIREFFGRNGLAREAFDQAFASPAVEARMRRAEELNALYGVTATPSLGVNGRYLTNPGLTGSNEKMLAVADAIVAAEAEERCDAGSRSRCPLE